MHLTALVKSPAHVCCRYRIAAYRPFLEAAGHRLDLYPWPGRWLSGVNLVQLTDGLIVQRRLLTSWQIAQVRRRARWLLFDFDDAVFGRDSYAARGEYSERRLRGFARMIGAADAVLAGNRFLAQQAGLWTNPDRIHHVPTCLDPHRYPLARHGPRAGIRLVWIGSSPTLRGLEQQRPLWEEIGKRLPGLSLTVICDRPMHLHELPVYFCPWSEKSETQALAAADMGISWLPNDLWSRGKCGLKVLQYMAAGLPVVANPVGVQADLVRHGETGFLAVTPDQWCAALARLAADPALRHRMGLAGRRRVETEFPLTQGAARWVTVLEQLSHGAAARVSA